MPRPLLEYPRSNSQRSDELLFEIESKRGFFSPADAGLKKENRLA